MDFHIRLKNGQLLKGIIRSPGEHLRAVIVFVHGVGEHIHRYDSWGDRFLSEGIALRALDLPGHGSSDGGRGYIKELCVA